MRTKASTRRSGRRGATIYKKGDYVEFILNSRTVTGRLVRKNARGWVVQPSDRRRKEETIAEGLLGKVINEEEARNKKGASRPSKKSTAKDDNSDGSAGEGSVYEPATTSAAAGATATTGNKAAKKRKNGGTRDSSTTTDEGVTPASTPRKRRKSEITTASDTNYSRMNNTKEPQSKQSTRKTVSFKKEGRKATTTASKSSSTKVTGTRIGTRSKMKLPENIEQIMALSAKSKKTAKKKGGFKGKKIGKDENVKVVHMLTGTLYLYRGERPRAEFVRNK